MNARERLAQLEVRLAQAQADHDRIVAELQERVDRLSEYSIKENANFGMAFKGIEAERDKLAERCRELEGHNRERDNECARMLNEAWKERDTLRAEIERLRESEATARARQEHAESVGDNLAHALEVDKSVRDQLRADYEYAFNSGEAARAECDILRAEAERLRELLRLVGIVTQHARVIVGGPEFTTGAHVKPCGIYGLAHNAKKLRDALDEYDAAVVEASR